MAKLHSLIALQQFMRGLGEDMEEAELVGENFQEQYNYILNSVIRLSQNRH